VEMIRPYTETTREEHNQTGLELSMEEKERQTGNIWRHEMESEIKRTIRTLKDLEKTTLDRMAWKDVVVDLCLQKGLERCGCILIP
jgi:hypothetical protein